MKKVLSFVLGLLMIFTLLSGSVFASEQELYELTPQRDGVAAQWPEGLDAQALSLAFAEGLANCAPIELYQLRIPFSQEVFQAFGDQIFYAMPEAFHVSGVEGTILNGYFNTIDPVYDCTAQEYEQMLEECRTVAQKILGDLLDNDSLSEAEKALLVHDRLAVHCEYDTSLVAENCHNMYGALAKGVAVCQGYAMSYMYLLNSLGIEASYVSSKLLNHGWNLVVIDGMEYHVDVTWDDPTPNLTGRVNHNNFLLSGQGIIGSGHVKNGYVDFDYSQSSTKYDNAYWKSSQSEFQLVDGELYYVDHFDVALKRAKDGSVLISVEDTWNASASSYWPGNYTRMSSDEGGLLYSLADGVYRYDLKSKSNQKVFTPDFSVGEYFGVYGFTHRDGNLICDLFNSPNFTAQAVEYRQIVPYTPPAVGEYLLGDANGDGSVNFADIQRLYQHLSTSNKLTGDALAAADANQDGTTSFADIQRIYQHLSGGSRLF